MRHNKGFTLVELAVSLMIIGLLIGGVLKGEELVGNARNSKYVRQLTGYQGAVNSFQVTYNALPGDFADPTRIPGCNADPCNIAGNDNLWIGADNYYGLGYSFPIATLVAGENRRFWVHLAKGGYIGDIDTSIVNGAAFTGVFGREIPKGPVDDVGIGVGYFRGVLSASWQPIVQGNFFVLRALVDTDFGLSPYTSAYIDQKMDDGMPMAGDVRALGGWTNNLSASCVTSAQYMFNTRNTPFCNLAVRIQ